MCTYTHAHAGMSSSMWRLTGIGTHATLVFEWRVLPSSDSSGGLVVGTQHAHRKLLTGRPPSEKLVDRRPN